MKIILSDQENPHQEATKDALRHMHNSSHFSSLLTKEYYPVQQVRSDFQSNLQKGSECEPKGNLTSRFVFHLFLKLVPRKKEPLVRSFFPSDSTRFQVRILFLLIIIHLEREMMMVMDSAEDGELDLDYYARIMEGAESIDLYLNDSPRFDLLLFFYFC